MKEIKGKYGTAKIFTDLVESTAIDQISKLMDQEFISDSKVRIMPDVHAGAGCTIGTTMTINGKCCPNLVGVDIGCGMLISVLGNVDVDLEKLDQVIHEKVPSGFNIHEPDAILPWHLSQTHLYDLRCFNHVDIERASRSLGTLGGGNHFIELNKDDDGCLYLVVHSGSRHLGLEVAGYYQRLAEKHFENIDKVTAQKLIATLKEQGRQGEIAEELRKAKESIKKPPKELSYLTGQLFNDYIHDMKIIQEYASRNREAISDVILRHMNLPMQYRFETIHNYIDTDNMILRKGAVSAQKGERLLIPINMRDGSLICIGKGDPDWNYSAPHGAGRLMSRAEAKKKFTTAEFADSMVGVYTTSVNDSTLDECPMAYKPMDSIVNNIGDTVEIEKVIRPIYNFKAGEA